MVVLPPNPRRLPFVKLERDSKASLRPWPQRSEYRATYSAIGAMKIHHSCLMSFRLSSWISTLRTPPSRQISRCPRSIFFPLYPLPLTSSYSHPTSGRTNPSSIRLLRCHLYHLHNSLGD